MRDGTEDRVRVRRMLGRDWVVEAWDGDFWRPVNQSRSKLMARCRAEILRKVIASAIRGDDIVPS